MIEVISVRFRSGCKAYFFDPCGISVEEGQEVVVETAQGAEFGVCVCPNHMVEDHAIIQPLRPMRRIATDEDRALVARNRKREKEAVSICEQKIAAHNLDMKLVNVECSFDGNKVIFFFTADGRVDFRDLVKDLASVFHARIELRQIGVRDEAKMLGGLGICGQPFCCKQFLDDFQPVSIKMAKTQNLSLNPTKISGSCGRLMCCLKYEQYAYEDAQTRMPKNDSFVQTPDGPGNVSAVNLVRESITVRLDETPESPKTYPISDVIVLRNGKGSRDGIIIPDRPQRTEQETAQDPFVMSCSEYCGSSCSSSCGSTSQKRSTGVQQNEKHSNRAPAEQPKKVSANKQTTEQKPAAKQEKDAAKPVGEKSGSRRSHRGGRGRSRGGDNRERQKNDQQRSKSEARNGEKQENRSAEKRENNNQRSVAPRPVYFGSSMPIASTTSGENHSENISRQKSGEGSSKNGGNNRRGRRPSRRGRGGNGVNKNNNTGKKEG